VTLLFFVSWHFVRPLTRKQSSGAGRLKLSDFRDVMCSLKQWQAAFKAHTREKMGILKAERFRDALLDVGK